MFSLLLQFNVSTDGFWVHAGDRIGWTNEDDFGVISFQYIEGHRTYFRKYENSEYPRTSDTYKFDNIDLPSMFSVAVKIDDSYSRTPGEARSWAVQIQSVVYKYNMARVL